MARVPAVEQPVEQLRYARWLEWGTRVGLLVLVVGFVAYVAGLLPTVVAPDKLPQLWSLPVSRFVEASGAPMGWGWAALLGHGDMLGMLGIALLAGCSLPPLLALVPLFAGRGDRAFAAVCLAEVAVVVLAASGLLSAGH
jgi:hypothetical protein